MIIQNKQIKLAYISLIYFTLNVNHANYNQFDFHVYTFFNLIDPDHPFIFFLNNFEFICFIHYYIDSSSTFVFPPIYFDLFLCSFFKYLWLCSFFFYNKFWWIGSKGSSRSSSTSIYRLPTNKVLALIIKIESWFFLN